MTRVSDAERIAEFTVSAISERRFELAGALARLMLQAYRIERDSAVASAVPVVAGAGEPVIYSAMQPPAADDDATAVTPSARCTSLVGPQEECHGVLYWSAGPGADGATGRWVHINGRDDHAPTPDRFL